MKKKILLWIGVSLIATGVIFIIAPVIFINYVLPEKESNNLSAYSVEIQEAAAKAGTSSEIDVSAEGTKKAAEDNQSNPGEDDSSGIAEEELQDDSSSSEPVAEILSSDDYFPAQIMIPEIELNWTVNEGADRSTLKKGPGHIPGTPFPGQEGRSVISGHRTTYGAPFNRLDELRNGDIIYIDTKGKGRIEFEVIESIVVSPKDLYVLIGSSRKQLLLTTCTPKFTATKRLIIIADIKQ